MAIFKLSGPEASRKFIDLIYHSSSKYANWSPSKKIEVGDFGTIDKKTGEFEKEGNIYTHPATVHIAKSCPPEPAAFGDNVLIVASLAVKTVDLGAEPHAELAGLADARIKGMWEFGDRRGALLVMDRPHITSVPPKILLRELVNIKELEGKVLVTEITTCPAYSLYLSKGAKDRIELALSASAPVPVVPGVGVGATAHVAWYHSTCNGFFTSGCDPQDKNSYTPLYVVKKIRQNGWTNRRDSPQPEPVDDETWVTPYVPWDPLNEDGEEEEFVDEVFDI